MFCNSINCHSIYHAFHTCRRVGSGIMIWAKVMEIKHKSCKEQIRKGNKREIITSAGRNLQFIFFIDQNFPKIQNIPGFTRINHDIYLKDPLFVLPEDHPYHSLNYYQTVCVKYMHKNICQGTVIQISNDSLDDVDTAYVDHVLVDSMVDVTHISLDVTLLKLIPTVVPFDFIARSTSSRKIIPLDHWLGNTCYDQNESIVSFAFESLM